MFNSKDFLFWEQLSRDTIDVKRVYIDIAEDLVAGILLSQIVYWYLPDKEGKTKLRVQKNGELWLAKGRNDWWDECRITPKQFDRAIKILQKKGLVEKKIFKFDGNPTVHIKLNLDVLISLISSILPKGENRNLPKGKNGIDQRGKTLTENTTENTTKINNNNKEGKNTLEENKKSTETTTQDVVVVKKLKEKINKVVGKISDDQLINLIKKVGIDKINEYIEKYPEFAKVQEILNPVGFFISAIIGNWSVPVTSTPLKINSFNNFEQHDYSEDELEYLFEPIE